MTMENAATKLVESAAVRTLHAHSFSRASHQATQVLTDLLARYLALLALSSAKHAHHAGRTSLSASDALAALEDLGVELNELAEFCSIEAKDLSRYASHSTRRLEDLNEFKVQLTSGLKQDRDDAILLDYIPYEHTVDDDDESDDDSDNDETAMIVDSPLLLSPVSAASSSSPSSKRPRTASWKPPAHIPSFLPPFPTMNPPSPPPLDLPDSHSATDLMPPPPDPNKPPIVPVSTQAMTTSSASASDYLVQVPYSQSSLSSVPEYHLPNPPPPTRAHRKSTLTNPPATTPTSSVLQTEPALFKAYHHILTHRPPPTPPPSSLSRHKVTMAFLSQLQNTPRWDAADSLFSTVAPCPPRVAVIGPSYPVPIGDPKDTTANAKDKEFRFPPTIPRPVSTTERLTPLLGQQSNRIPELARHVLPPVIMNRITRLAHPPVLYRGTKPIIYGRGIPAPWNSHSTTAPDPSSTIPPTPSSSSSFKDKDGNNKDKDKDREGGGESLSKPLIPDAQLFATWDFEQKDYKLPLPSSTTVLIGSAGTGGGAGSSTGGVGVGVGGRHRTSSRVGSLVVQPSPSAGIISLGPLSAGARSKSGSKHG